jgi:hypothetical protein
MVCRTVTVVERAAKLGMTSIRPKIGSGFRSAHSYCYHYKNAGYAAYSYMSWQAVDAVVSSILNDDVRLNANVLFIRSHDDNPAEKRHIYMFMPHEADWFVLKTYLSLIDPKLIDKDLNLNPYMFPLKS